MTSLSTLSMCRLKVKDGRYTYSALTMYANIDEPINLVGISSFINAADGGMDVREVERSLVEQTEQLSIKDADPDLVSEFQRRISSMGSAMGISLSNQPQEVGVDNGPADDSGAGGRGFSGYSDMNDSASNGASNGPSGGDYGGASYGNMSNNAGNYAPSTGWRPMHNDPGLVNMSNEQHRQRILQNALNSINTHSMSDGDKFSLDAEKENDTKNLLLEQINMLRTNLADDDIKISDVRVVSTENTLEEVERVFEQLRYRNDHARYCGFAKELAEVGAYGLEWAFDGKKNYFGIRPNLTGWGATLNIKMRRLRYETSRLVSDGMAAYNLGNFSRLCLELVPSMVIHSKMLNNKSIKGGGANSSSRPSDAEMSKAIDRIRDKSVIRRESHGTDED